VAPSAPWDQECHKRWNLPEADEYISAVIRECEHRFNIDGNRIFLGGHSMGGFGAYHLCQRLNDRIAGGLLSAGAWKTSDFRCLAGTGVFIVHGRNDTAPGASPVKGQGTRENEWTGVSFARGAVERMKRDGCGCVYHEHGGGHAFRDGKDGMSALAITVELASFHTSKCVEDVNRTLLSVMPAGRAVHKLPPVVLLGLHSSSR